MKILLANNFVRPGGGVDAVVNMERRCLRDAQHEVVDLRVDNADFDRASGFGRLGMLASALYSFPARKRMRALLAEHDFDIVHVHNTVPFLTGAVYDACRAHAGPKVVVSLHNYRAFCLSAYAFRGEQPCWSCLSKGRFLGVVHGCYRGSRAQSLFLLAARGMDRLRGRRFGMDADAYIAVSAFVRDVHLGGGLLGESIYVVPNAVPDPISDRRAKDLSPARPEQMLVYVGSLLKSKGILLICDLAQHLPDYAFHVIGDGEDRAALERRIRDLGLGNVTLHGFLEGGAKTRVWQDALFTLVPSTCPEAFPMVALESLALGVPVLASGAGGLTESVRHEKNGYVVDFEDPRSIADRIRRSWSDPDLHRRLGRCARRVFEAEYSEQGYADRLCRVFEQVLEL